ncbi:TMEM175 family protein [Oerskovia sp. M15]
MLTSRTPRGLDRLVNFTDAAVAIAITLLVLPLVDLVADGEAHSVRALVQGESGTFLAFAISFVVIARFWTAHHRVFEHLRDYSEPSCGQASCGSRASSSSRSPPSCSRTRVSTTPP